eukprot:11444802-Heterocapsa_arctica.AAC.1
MVLMVLIDSGAYTHVCPRSFRAGDPCSPGGGDTAGTICRWPTIAEVRHEGRGVGVGGRRDAEGNLPGDERLQGDPQRRGTATRRLGM